MRRVKVEQGGMNNKTYEGWFHGWFQDHEDYENGPGHYPVALVEDYEGHVHWINVCSLNDHIQFLDPPEKK